MLVWITLERVGSLKNEKKLFVEHSIPYMLLI